MPYPTFELSIQKKCPDCGQSYVNFHKRCDSQGASYKDRKNKQKKVIRMRKIKEEEELDYKERLVSWDLETFPDPINSVHTVYASGYTKDNEYKQHYGANALQDTIDDFIQFENKIITAYNGSRFDFYFLLNKLIERGIKVKDLMISNGRIMSFSYGAFQKENTICDLYLFINSSLSGACKDFKIKNQKSSFEHSKMKTWEDVEKYRSEVEPYLKLDVLTLQELFETFNSFMYKIIKTNITNFKTISHLAYEIWTNMDPKTKGFIVEVPDEEKYAFIKLGTYGARCYPQQREYQSPYYEEIISGKMTYEELKNTDEFKHNSDVSSLYPASMSEYSYPVGKSRWSENPNVEYNNHKIGLYTINFIPPTNIRIPILPRKEEMSLIWSLEAGTGVYTNIDIKNAIENGYAVTFIDKCLVWDKAENIFGDYVRKFYELKVQAEADGNDVIKSITKLLLNALYGKQLQRAIHSEN